MQKAGFNRELSVKPSHLEDFIRSSAPHYALASFRKTMTIADIGERLKLQGYQGATIRETLSLLNAHPGILEDRPNLIICGSTARGEPESYPFIKVVGQWRMLSYLHQTRSLQALAWTAVVTPHRNE